MTQVKARKCRDGLPFPALSKKAREIVTRMTEGDLKSTEIQNLIEKMLVTRGIAYRYVADNHVYLALTDYGWDFSKDMPIPTSKKKSRLAEPLYEDTKFIGKIEVGKTYKNRVGKEFGPLVSREPEGDFPSEYLFTDGTYTWTSRGSWGPMNGSPTYMDLVVQVS